MFKLIATAIVQLCVIAGFALRTKACEAMPADGPMIHGLRLRMSYPDAQAVLGLKIKKPKNGEGSFFQNFIDRPAAGNLAGVRAIYLRFYQNKIYQIEIFYEDGGRRGDLRDTIARLSSELSLSPDAWKIKNDRATIVCGDIAIQVDNILNPHIELTDEAALAELETKKEKEKASKRGDRVTLPDRRYDGFVRFERFAIWKDMNDSPDTFCF